MSTHLEGVDNSQTRRIRAEAASWVARLHGPDRDADVEAGLKRWLAEDPRHGQAFELATEVWQETAELPAELPAAQLGARIVVGRPHVERWMWATAAGVGIVAVGAALFGYLHYADTLATGVGERRTVTLEDGSRVELNTHSRLRVKYDASARRVVLESGEAYFDVAQQTQRPFVVQAGDREVVALGTEFVVRRDGDGVSVTLLEGRVAITSSHGTAEESRVDVAKGAQVLQPGERLSVGVGGPAVVDLPVLEKVTAWQRGQLVFEDTPLDEAAAEFNRYSRNPLELGSGDIREIHVGGTFRVGDAARFARAVAESHGLSVLERDGALVLTRNER